MAILEAKLSKFISENFAHVSLRVSPFNQCVLVFESESEFGFLPNPMSLQKVDTLFVDAEYYEDDGYEHIFYHLLDTQDRSFQMDIISLDEYVESSKRDIERYEKFVRESKDFFEATVV